MSASTSPFVLPVDQYKRDVNMLQHYARDVALFLHQQTGRDLSVCQNFVKRSLSKEGRFEFKDTTVEFLKRGENGDRERFTGGLSRFINESVQTDEIIAPTFTTYLHPKVETSLLSKYLSTNVKKRGKAKKEMFAAEAAGNDLLYFIKKLEQGNRKTSNNSVSGAHVSDSTPLFNKTAHSSLTSTCRITSGYGNANNEKFLSGNRHYFNHHIVLNNLVVIVNNVDYDKIRSVMSKHNLHYPTQDEVLQVIQYSTDLYWTFGDVSKNKYFQRIVQFVRTMTPEQCAAFVYVGDLYHLKKYNEQFVRKLFERLSTKAEVPMIDGQFVKVYPNPIEIIHSVPESYTNLAHQICQKETMGIGKDYKLIADKADIQTLAMTCVSIQSAVQEYSEVIQAFWVTPNMPASVAHLPTSIRRVALTSDTDSTIFTVQDWVIWYKNKVSFDEEAMSVAASAIFLASETITHILAMMSANIGVIPDNLFKIAMKNEFKFDVFVPTQLGKHYYACISCQEGNVYKKRKTEIKGVGLKSSNAPSQIVASATKMMESIMQDVIDGGSIKLKKYLDWVAKEELEIFRSLQSGEPTYLRSGTIKDVASYSSDDAEKTPYLHHMLWNEVFGPKYGMMAEPPYAVLKVSIDADSPSLFKEYLNGIQDKELAQRFAQWMKQYKKDKFSTFQVPMEVISGGGIPKEILDAVNMRKIVADICKIFYVILETLGVYLSENKVIRLVSDYHTPGQSLN